MEKERKAVSGGCRRAHPAIGNDKCTKQIPDVKCTYKCTDLEDDQWDCKSIGVMMRRSSQFNVSRTIAFMSAKALPNQNADDIRKYRIVYRTALQE